jgi:heptosyltransferase I
VILYIKNIVSFIIFLFLKIFFKRIHNPDNKNILFYNPEKIGDLTISSVILEDDDIFPDDVNVYFLIKDNYYSLLENYNGKIKIITYNYNKYKWILFYRFILINRLRSLQLDKFFNLTPARGMLSDELSLLSGANKIYSISNNKNYLKGIAGKITDKYYDEILFSDIKNVYEKHINLLRLLGNVEKEIVFKNEKVFKITGSNYLIEKGLVKEREYIVISPLSSEMEKTWGVENYGKLSNKLAEDYKIVLIGSGKEKSLLEKIKNNNEKIIIAETSLKELPEIINNCYLFIGGNSGPAHIALQLGVRFLVILYGGYFNWYFPYRAEDKNNNYVYHFMDCFECGVNCIHEKILCLENLKYDEVISKVYKILNNQN